MKDEVRMGVPRRLGEVGWFPGGGGRGVWEGGGEASVFTAFIPSIH